MSRRKPIEVKEGLGRSLSATARATNAAVNQRYGRWLADRGNAKTDLSREEKHVQGDLEERRLLMLLRFTMLQSPESPSRLQSNSGRVQPGSSCGGYPISIVRFF